MKKILLITFIATIILSLFIGCNEKEIVIDAKNLAKIEVEGISAKGRVYVSPDKEIIDSVVKELEPEIKGQQRYNDFLLSVNTIKYKILSPQENISNGDKISIEAVYDEALIKKAKVKIENAEFTYIVSGLTELIMIDPFAEIELVYEGISSEAKVEVFNRSEKQFIRDIRYDVEPNYNLRIGDKVVVTANLDADAAESNGFLVPDLLTKDYTVENIDEYVKDFNEIDQATKDKIKKEGLDRVESSSVDKYSGIAKSLGLFEIGTNKLDDTKFDTPELTNIYFNTLKQGGAADSKNDIFYVYKVTAHYKEEPEPRTAFVAVRFNNAVKKVDGSIDLNLVADTSAFNYGIYASGKDLDAVYREVVTAQKKAYEIQEITPQ